MKRGLGVRVLERARAYPLHEAAAHVTVLYPMVDAATKRKILGMLEQWIAYERRQLAKRRA